MHSGGREGGGEDGIYPCQFLTITDCPTKPQRALSGFGLMSPPGKELAESVQKTGGQTLCMTESYAYIHLDQSELLQPAAKHHSVSKRQSGATPNNTVL